MAAMSIASMERAIRLPVVVVEGREVGDKAWCHSQGPGSSLEFQPKLGVKIDNSSNINDTMVTETILRGQHCKAYVDVSIRKALELKGRT